jgi:hypothetical protein
MKQLAKSTAVLALLAPAAAARGAELPVTLTVPARSWVDGVLYDYLRLELDERGGKAP